MKWKGSFIVLVILAMTCLSGCGEKDTSTVRIGYLPIVPDITFFIAEQKGYFEDEGLKVDPVKFAKSIQAIEALTTDRIDATSVVGLSNLFAVEQNVSGTFKIFEMTYAGENSQIHKIIAKNGSGIVSLSDLKGKTIGTFPGSQMKAFTKLVLAGYLDPEKEITIVPLSPPNQKEALASGRVDALFTLEPQGTQVEELGIGTVIYSNPLYDLVLKPFPTAASVISTRFVDEHPKEAAKLVRAFYRAFEYLENHPEESKLIMAEYLELEPEVALKVGVYKHWRVDQIDTVSVNALSDLYVENDVLEKKVNISTMLYSQGN